MLPPRAYTFIGLNIVRALSIIALLLVFASSIVTMVHDIEAVNRFIAAGKSGDNSDMIDCDYIEGSTVPNQPAGAFWAVVNRFFIIGQVIVLILSEIGWPASFFNRFFPVLGNDFGLGALGVIQSLIGAAILSHFVDDFALVSAFFLFSIGCLNILIGLIWRQSAKIKRSPTAWKDHAKSVLPTHVAGIDIHATGSSIFSREKHSDSESTDSFSSSNKAGYGFGRQGEKAAALKGFMLSKPVESLPKYVPKLGGNKF